MDKVFELATYLLFLTGFAAVTLWPFVLANQANCVTRSSYLECHKSTFSIGYKQTRYGYPDACLFRFDACSAKSPRVGG